MSLLTGGRSGRTNIPSDRDLSGDATDHIGQGSGVARDIFLRSRDGLVLAMFSASARSRHAAAAAGPLGEINGRAPPVSISWSDRAQECFFGVMQDRPSGACTARVTLKKIIFYTRLKVMPRQQ